ncbi:MAG: DNA repair protein RadC [Candidatus Shapirobacteria bacterium]
MIITKIKDIPKVDRPREKLIKSGAKFLKDYELLAILLGTGTKGKNVLEVAQDILSSYPKKKLLGLDFTQFKKINGIGPAKATQILAAFEFASRVLEVDSSDTLPIVRTSKDIIAQISFLREHKKENFVVLYLNSRDELLNKETISVGTLNASLVHPREVFEPAARYFAAQIILAHNHPSGDSEPSEDDLIITKRLVEAGKIMGIEVNDHIIITKNSFFSFKENGLI